MGKVPLPKAKTNKFCGERGCKLNFVHWHGAFDPRTIHVPAPAEPEIAGYNASIAIVDDPTEEKDPLGASAIEAAIRALPVSDDPEADRFKGMSKEEAAIQVVKEHVVKLMAKVDKIDTGMPQVVFDQLAKIEHAANQSLEKQQERPAWMADYVTWLSAEHVELRAILKEFRGATLQRHAGHTKQILSVHADIARTLKRYPGFWTTFMASMAGGAALLCLVVLTIVATYMYVR